MTESLEPIAIIGMACRFPGAEDPPQFWRLLLEGTDATGEIPAERWDRELLHDADLQASGKVHTWRGGFLRQVDGCDWRALRLLPREARHMDPQHRLLLELAWEALEDSGLPFESVAGSRAGVFVGIQWNDFLRLLGRDWSRLDGYALLGNAQMLAANRVSYAFDLRGPSLALDCGCASGLASLKLACQSLWLGEADLALAGACELVLAPEGSIAAEAAGLISRSGNCLPLHAAADGFLRGEGAGMLVLKRLSRLAPADRAYAVVRSVAVNHNGHNEWLMASSPRAQQEAMREACARAGIAPGDLDYVELHAAGNPRGDALEVKALAELLAASGERSRPCLLGAVKGQLGHLGRASGMAALVKTALALHHRLVPPMPAPAADEVHPGLPLASLGLELPARVLPWPAAGTAGTPTAGVSALSLGGANAHAILQAAPRQPRLAAATAPRTSGRQRAGPWLLPLSARCPAALAELARRYARRLRELELEPGGGERLDQAVGDFCWTAALGRSHHAHRAAVVGGTSSELVRELEAVAAAPPRSPRTSPGPAGRSGAPAAGTGRPEPLEALAALAALYTAGGNLDWRAVCPADGGVTSLPGYPWQRVSMWPSWLDARAISTAPEAVAGGGSAGELAAPSSDAAAAADPRDPAARSLCQRLALAAPPERGRLLAGYLRGQLRRLLPGEASDLDAVPLAELGLDSLTAHELSVRLEADLATVLPIAEIFGARSLAELADRVAERLAERWRSDVPLPPPGPAARGDNRAGTAGTEIEVFRL